MKSLFSSLALLSLAGGVAAQNTGSAAGPPVPAIADEVDYIRYEEEAGLPSRLQTAVVRFEKGRSVVDLVGVVHLGDAAYYENLNELLKGYDAVLYEMVGGTSPGTSAATDPAAAPEMVSVRRLQELARSFLGLEFQIDRIDYSARNFVHADVAWGEFAALMQARNQNFATLFTRALSLAEEGGVAGFPNDEEAIAAMMQRIFAAVMSGDSNELKRSIAPFISESEEFITRLEGDDGTVLVSERNRVVMEVLAEESTVRGGGKFAVFYGAGHMPDLERRLLAAGFTKGESIWLDAWSIPDAEIAGADGSGAAGGAPSSADVLGKLLEDNPGIMTTIQQLGSLLEALRAAAEGQPVE
ncbi:MAG: TraB/GumN family protein [Verrucomicrobiaceae bacterium]|nr:TraB/GumN family protein [Verrucomicrobiaceae bacterium]